jgi:hypothetical protein
MSKNQIYKITVLNWEKHNPKAKSIYKKTLISNGFLTDAKIRQLSPGGKLLFLSCLLVSGESGQSQIEVSHDSLCFQSGVKSGSVQSQLDLLQSLQLLTYEKNASLIKEVKEKKEKEVKEKKFQPSQKSEPNPLNSKIWEAYKDAYLRRYKIEPVRNAKVNTNISQLGKRVGDDSVDLVYFYLNHNDGFYLKNLHPISLCLANAESLHSQMKRNRPVTSVDVRNFEKQQNLLNLTKAVRDGENF